MAFRMRPAWLIGIHEDWNPDMLDGWEIMELEKLFLLRDTRTANPLPHSAAPLPHAKAPRKRFLPPAIG